MSIKKIKNEAKSEKEAFKDFARVWNSITKGEAKKMKARINERRKERSRLDELHEKYKNFK